MSAIIAGYYNDYANGQRKVFWAIFGSLVALACIAGALFLREKNIYGLMVLATPLAIIVACSPRLALYQFVISIFFPFSLAPGVAFFDASAVLLILAAIVDKLVNTTAEHRHVDGAVKGLFSRHYILLTLAMALSAVFAFDITLTLRPILRLLMILSTFIAISRLMRSSGIGASEALKFFFWIAVVHSCVAVFDFVASAGNVRTFGLTGKTLDDFNMLALPIGLAYYIGSETSTRRFCFAIGSLLVFIALLATQSRAPIVFGVFGGALTLWWASKGSKQKRFSSKKVFFWRNSANRIKSLIGILFGLILLVSILDPDIISAAVSRFERLITANPSGTFRLRLTLWESAWMAFVDNPAVGLGPGNFKAIGDAYSTLHLDPARHWVAGLSAHNLLLHSLAETGLLGGVALIALFWKPFRKSLLKWKQVTRSMVSDSVVSGTVLSTSLSLAVISTLIFITTILEAGWLWSQTGFLAMFMLALIANNCDSVELDQ